MVGNADGITRRNGFAALAANKKKSKSKPKVVEEPEAPPPMFWPPAPLPVKSWADVDDDDDDDYYATTAPPLKAAWGAPETIKSRDVSSNLDEESESEYGLDEGDDDVDEESEHDSEVPAPAEPVLTNPPPVLSVPKDAERQLSKKEIKKKELAELETVLTELGISVEDNQSSREDEVKGTAEEKKQEHSGNEKKENAVAPSESKTSKKKKAKKEKPSKESKDSREEPKGSDVIATEPAVVDTPAVDIKERLKSMKKKSSSKEMDSPAKIAAAEAAKRRLKLDASKKKEKNHYNQQPVR